MKETLTWHLNPKINEYWAYLDNVFSAEECQQIIALGTKLETYQAEITKNTSIELEIRKNKVGFFNSSDKDNTWIYQRITDATTNINRQFFNYDLDYIELLQFTVYDQLNDHYIAHMDSIMPLSVHNRKLSFSLQLSAADAYQGCDLEIFRNGEYQPATRTQGSMIFFPSFILHKVTPLTRGKRHSLVGWVCGPNFK
jgi:PKHD-type hydroxylase